MNNGVIRQIDHLGRVVIPVEFRRTIKVKAGDEVSIGIDGETVTIKKVQNSCVVCRYTAGPFVSVISAADDEERLICSVCVDLIEMARER